jgi:hypothetical protein
MERLQVNLLRKMWVWGLSAKLSWMNPLPGLKPGVSGLWHIWYELQPCQMMPEKASESPFHPGSLERMLFIPSLKAWGFSGHSLKMKFRYNNSSLV